MASDLVMERRCDFDDLEYICDSGDLKEPETGAVVRHAIVRLTDNRHNHQRERIRCEYRKDVKWPQASYALASVWIPVVGWSQVTMRTAAEILAQPFHGDEPTSEDIFFDMWHEVFEVRRGA